MAGDHVPSLATQDALTLLLQRQREAFLAELPVSLKVRQDRLDRAIAMLLKWRTPLHEAVMTDFPQRGSEWSLLTEIFAPIQVLQGARKSVHRWMRPERRKAPLPFNVFGARAEIQYQPLGVVGIMGAWNAPINLVLVPMATALAAGNRTFLCPSDMMPRSAQVLEEAVREYFDSAEVAVAHGGLEVSKAFARLPFDHLMFTGSPPVGALVMSAAAPNLTPVTLELGGKCPVVVAPDADVTETAQRLIKTKTMNGGQACLAPDLLFAPRDKVQALIAELDTAMRQLYPAGPQNPDYVGLVGDRYYQRLLAIIDEARGLGADVKALGDGVPDGERYRLPLHVIIDPPSDSRAANEELFGPVLTLIPYDSIDDACARLRQMSKPLGLYVFSKREAFTQYVLDRTFSGGVTVNDAMFHYSVPDLPFGGVGRSGMGAYSFGVEGFRRFSHARSIYTQGGPQALMRVMLPPYGKLYDTMIRGTLNRLEKRYATRSLRPKR
jgi:coniferyl-aldehyde dehydrogenase